MSYCNVTISAATQVAPSGCVKWFPEPPRSEEEIPDGNSNPAYGRSNISQVSDHLRERNSPNGSAPTQNGVATLTSLLPLFDALLPHCRGWECLANMCLLLQKRHGPHFKRFGQFLLLFISDNSPCLSNDDVALIGPSISPSPTSE